MPPEEHTTSEETKKDSAHIKANHVTPSDSTPETTIIDAAPMETTTMPDDPKELNRDLLKVAPVYRVHEQIGVDSKEMHV